MLRHRMLARTSLVTFAFVALAVAQDDAANQPPQSYVGSSSRLIRPPFGITQSTDLTSMLMQSQIQEDLNLTADQRDAISELRSLRNKARMEVSQKFSEMTAAMRKRSATGERPDRAALEEMRKASDEYRKAREQAEANADAAVFETLDPKQTQRLLQIQLQIALKSSGIAALAQPPISDMLTITGDQKRKHVEKQLENEKELERMMAVLREEMEHEALSEVLSKSQLDKLNEMKGDTLTIDQPDYYSSLLRRQVLGDDRTLGRQLLDGARKVINDATKDLKDGE